MKKKKFDLTSDLVILENHTEDKVIEQNKKEKSVLITLSVEEQFRYEFKSWCARHRVKMNEAVINGFKLLKEKYGP